MQQNLPHQDHYFQLAVEMADLAHAPYSSFPVGCVILDERGQPHTGCNVENASLGLTMCAERVATGNAISSGARRFDTIIVASPDAVSPCGACRQVLAEFSHDQTMVFAVDLNGQRKTGHLLSELLPNQFKLQS